MTKRTGFPFPPFTRRQFLTGALATGALTGLPTGLRADGLDVSSIHLRHLNPFPSNLGEVLSRFRRVLVPELNLGQLSKLLRAEFLTPAESLTKVQGQPFQVAEIHARIAEMLRGGK